MKRRRLAAVLLAVPLAACTVAKPNRVEGAVTSPLNDLNVVRVAIPPLLDSAEKQPYEVPADLSCNALRARVKELDEVLGPDVDVPPPDANADYVDRAETTAGDEAIGALRRTAEGFVPFRGWVRKLTGAERYSKRVAAAIAAGTARRAFLKGIRTSRGCAPDLEPIEFDP
jgi:hypothetical protein